MSAGLNTVSGTLYEDFLSKWMPKKTTDAQASFIMKVIVVVIGVLCILLIYVIERLGTILQMAISIAGITNGGILAVFTMGIFLPWVNQKGAIAGLFASLIFMSWIVIGAQVAIYNRSLQFLGKPTSIESCPPNITTTDPKDRIGADMIEFSPGVYATQDVFPLYRISYMYYTMIGNIVGIVIGTVVSYATGWQDLENLDPKYITPIMRRFLPKKSDLPLTQENEQVIVELKQMSRSTSQNDGYQQVSLE